MSESGIPATAVFDIGKTNKKFLLFDRDYHIIYKKQTTFGQIEDDDGDPSEDLSRLTSWVRQELTDAIRNPEYIVSHLNFSGYGASLVHLDSRGEVVGCLYDYMKPVPDEVTTSFYSLFGGEEKMALETASPPMGMLNSGLQLYWLKRQKPSLFGQISTSLHFPQFLSYLFTGKPTSELTSIGCHTAMWNFQTGDYHPWLKEEGVQKLLPAIQPVRRTITITVENRELEAGPGIHDSSAALAPCLIALDEPFLLLSTGTWSIAFNPFNREPLTYNELRQDCLCYINIYGRQVKAARLYLGNEYRFQKEKLNRHFQRNSDNEEIRPDADLLRRLIQSADPAKRLKLETVGQSGPYPSAGPAEWDVSRFRTYEEAYHQLMLDLVVIQEKSITLTEGNTAVEQLIVTGGFASNEFFLRLLASRLAHKQIFTADMTDATALGTALVMDGKAESETGKMKKLLNLKRHSGLENTGISGYSWSEE